MQPRFPSTSRQPRLTAYVIYCGLIGPSSAPASWFLQDRLSLRLAQSSMGVVIEGYFSSNGRAHMMPTHFLLFLRFLDRQELELWHPGVRGGAWLLPSWFSSLLTITASKSRYIPSAFRVAILMSGTSGLVGTAHRRTFKKTIRNVVPIMTRLKFAGTSSEFLSLCSPNLRLFTPMWV